MILEDAFQPVNRIAKHLKDVLHVEVTLQPWAGAPALPPFLRDRYEFYQTNLYRHPCLLMLDGGKERSTPAAIQKHWRQVASHWNGIVVYAATSVTATDRNRLIAAGVPFVVPGRQLYLLPLGIDFREQFAARTQGSHILGAVAQLLVLGELLGKDWVRQNPTDLSRRLCYSKMTIGRAFEEICGAGLAKVQVKAKRKHLLFSSLPRDLWGTALPSLRSPVRAETEVARLPENVATFVAGFSALSDLTTLAAPDTPAYAAYSLDLARMQGARNPEPGTQAGENHGGFLLQKWIYDPGLLAEGHRVDRLSLYLSLRHASDERVDKALAELLQELPW